MEQAFVAWLQRNGWAIISESHGQAGAPDIVAQDPRGRRNVFEVKADRPKGQGRRGSERSVDYPTLIGQICTRMSDPDADYGIVISTSGLPWFKQRLPKLALQRLGIRLFVVDDSIVQELDAEYNPRNQPHKGDEEQSRMRSSSWGDYVQAKLCRFDK